MDVNDLRNKLQARSEYLEECAEADVRVNGFGIGDQLLILGALAELLDRSAAKEET